MAEWPRTRLPPAAGVEAGVETEEEVLSDMSRWL